MEAPTTAEELLAEITRAYHRLDKGPKRIGPPELVAYIRELSAQYWALSDPETIGWVSMRHPPARVPR